MVNVARFVLLLATPAERFATIFEYGRKSELDARVGCITAPNRLDCAAQVHTSEIGRAA
jgi:hypothetical protein